MIKKKCTHKDHKGPNPLPIVEFSRHPHTMDGYQSICKACNLRLVKERQAEKRKKREEAKWKTDNYVERREDWDYIEGTDWDYKEDFRDIPGDILIKDL